MLSKRRVGVILADAVALTHGGSARPAGEDQRSGAAKTGERLGRSGQR